MHAGGALILRNARVVACVPGDDNFGEWGLDVVLEGDRIVDVGPGLCREGAVVVDLSGKWLIPGLIDACTRIGLEVLEQGEFGRDANEISGASQVKLKVIDGIDLFDPAFSEALSGGVTTVYVGPGDANVIGGQGAILRAWGRSLSDRVVREVADLKAAIGDLPRRTYRERDTAPVTRMAEIRILRDMLESNLHLSEVNASGNVGQSGLFSQIGGVPRILTPAGRIMDSAGGPAADLTGDRVVYQASRHDLLQCDSGIVAQILKRKIPLRIHAKSTRDVLAAIRLSREYGVDLTLEHASGLPELLDDLTDDVAGCNVIYGPLLTVPVDPDDPGCSPENAAGLLRRGIPIALTTDHPSVPVQNLRLLAALLLGEGISPCEALRTITIYAARVLGLEDEVGTIEPGKRADLVVLDGSPFDIASRVEYVYAGGEKVAVKRVALDEVLQR